MPSAQQFLSPLFVLKPTVVSIVTKKGGFGSSEAEGSQGVVTGHAHNLESGGGVGRAEDGVTKQYCYVQK